MFWIKEEVARIGWILFLQGTLDLIGGDLAVLGTTSVQRGEIVTCDSITGITYNL